MKKEYDFSKSIRNPYAKLLKRQVTIRLDQSTIAYFKALAEEAEIPYQTLINLYLRDCASSERRLGMAWTAQSRRLAASRDKDAHRAVGESTPKYRVAPGARGGKARSKSSK